MAEPSVNSRADRVWLRLAQTYGERFTREYGEDPSPMWVEMIDKLTDDQIKFGLGHITRVSPDHPPTLGRFRSACVDMPLVEARKVATLQEQLTEYTMLKLFRSTGVRLSDGTWNYAYRQWTDETLAKHHQRCAQCVGVIIERRDGVKIGFTVEQMMNDEEYYPLVVGAFDGSRARSELAERERRQLNLPDLTQ